MMEPQTMSARATFSREVARFKGWALERFPEGRGFGEWECDYEFWEDLYAAFVDHLNEYTPDQWDDDDRSMLLYVLARDNEVQRLQAGMETRPHHLRKLAHTALRSADRDARWQLADALATLGREDNEALGLLKQFFADPDEYVRRRALLAMSKVRHPSAEQSAVQAWQSGGEYARIAALEVLQQMESTLLPKYVGLAHQDGRMYVVQCAERIQSKLRQS
jgi:hypothetical protein